MARLVLFSTLTAAVLGEVCVLGDKQLLLVFKPGQIVRTLALLILLGRCLSGFLLYWLEDLLTCLDQDQDCESVEAEVEDGDVLGHHGGLGEGEHGRVHQLGHVYHDEEL